MASLTIYDKERQSIAGHSYLEGVETEIDVVLKTPLQSYSAAGAEILLVDAHDPSHFWGKIELPLAEARDFIGRAQDKVGVKKKEDVRMPGELRFTLDDTEVYIKGDFSHLIDVFLHLAMDIAKAKKEV